MDKVGVVTLKVTAYKVDDDDPKASLVRSGMATDKMPTLGEIGEAIESALASDFPGLAFSVGDIERTDI